MKIPSPPYFCGPGWDAEFTAWMGANLPAEYHGRVRSEAMIAWNTRGGRPSGHFYSALAETVDALNAGQVPNFPLIDWNNRFLARQRAEREAAAAAGKDLYPNLEDIR